ncbi:MAG TPA: hypothetical protein VGX00_01905 [Thermoplasmata archaeon]|nr:hypothetical protein [Thermoplasmata archaeon]
MYKVAKGDFPIRATMRDSNETITLSSLHDAFNHLYLATWRRTQNQVWSGYTAKLDSSGSLVLEVPGGDGSQTLRIYGFQTKGDPEVAFFDPYSSLNVVSRTVVDVGCGTLESSIRFLLQGANRVIAIDSDQDAMQFARLTQSSDLKLGAIHLIDSALVVSAPCSEVTGKARSSDAGITLRRIAKDFDLHHAVLKLDCEGCEYGVFEFDGEVMASAFDQIVVEYHYGGRGISEQLRKLGFKTRTTASARRMDGTRKSSSMFSGYLYARK